MKLVMTSEIKIIPVLLMAALVGAGVFSAGCSKPTDKAANASETRTLYTCGMHPQIVQDHPGNCPICGMKLQPIRKEATAAGAPAACGKGKILYYKSTMMPGETSPKPGKDSMGMDLVPVYENEAAAASSSIITIDPATAQLMNIQTAEVTRGPLRRTIRTVGTIDYNETTLADVTTKFKGWIEKLNVDTTGQLVHRGESLFEIYSPELYSAEAEYLAATEPGDRTADGDSLRAAALTKLKYFDISVGQIAGLDRTRQAQKTLSILAPQDGFVIEKKVVQGQMVDAGMPIYRLADLGIVWVYAQVYEQDLPYVQLGQEATVRLSSLPDRKFRGRVTYVYPDVDPKTRTAKVRLEFENPGYFLKPGMFVSVQIVAELKPSVLLLPDSAILRSGEKDIVFVALPGGKFEARDVVLGPEAENNRYEIIGGLQEGERVVASGQFMLDSESQLREAIQKMNGGPGQGETPGESGAATNPPAADGSRVRSPHQAETAEPLVYVCPMPEHVSITYDHPGNCPICGMALVPVTAGELKQLRPGGKVRYYTCPMPEHSDVRSDKPGKCPICGMTLIPVMASPEANTNSAPANTNPSSAAKPEAKQIYTCPMHPDVISDQPGKCPKCGMDLVPMTNTAK